LDVLQFNLNQYEKSLSREKKQLEVFRQQLKLTRVCAGIEGIVLTHDTEHMIGRTVREGQTVLRIGSRNEYFLQCEVSEKDVSLILSGQNARVQILPFPKGEYKLFKAVVYSVGADTFVSMGEDANLLDSTSQTLFKAVTTNRAYPVILKLEKPYTFSLYDHNYEIKPGFSAEADIIVSRERISKYILRRVLRIKGNLFSDKVHF
jgi:multidrug resistance efflux pump